MSTRRCKDCPPGTATRPAPHPGPRCATHHRQARKHRQARLHEARVGQLYGLAPGEYRLLYQGQNGCCWICQRAYGRTKRLAVDHDHARTGRASVRGLLCSPCNRMLGHLRDDPEALFRAAHYLLDPPAHRILAGMS